MSQRISQNGSHLPPDLLDLYLDGQLDERQRREVEALLEKNPLLRRQVEAQRMIDAALVSRFAPPAVVPAVVPVESPHGSNGAASGASTAASSSAAGWARAGGANRWMRILQSRWSALAAMLLISIAVWRIWTLNFQSDNPDTTYPAQAYRPMEVVYRAEVRNGCKPQWLCRDEREFVTTFHKRLGHGIALKPLRPGIEARGLSLTNTITPESVYLLSKVDGQVVLVFADRLEKDRPQKLPDPSLHLFRKELGPVVLYEVSPYSKPSLLDAMELREVPQEWKEQ